ncbi:hypothetical protein J2X54_001552 [Duganella sp. 3397]|uniref:hypothetical protein n=1 Tax=Duganella sp. 3397 TaxID=2817732 RepID=UPI00285F73E8|nr:hypothetical protein [Duganella sp. 3397]MDR7049104.1 hypothetical protein [Duganella sp. 3397]
MRLATILATCFAMSLCSLASAGTRSADLCPATQTGEEWSSECFVMNGSDRAVKPQYLKQINANRHGMAVITITAPREMVAVNRAGAVVIPGIRHTGDFDYPNAEHGIGRFLVDSVNDKGQPVSKCGYFKAGQFSVVVPARYDQCRAVANDKIDVCSECVSYCTDAECHNTIFVGGKGLVMTTAGKVLRSYAPPALDKVCRDGQPPKITTLNGSDTQVLQCKPAGNSPFGM